MEARTQDPQNEVLNYEIGKIIEDVPFELYQKSPGMNSSALKDILQSPAHFYERKYNQSERKETPALKFGKLFHYAVLECELFRKRAIVEPNVDKRTKEGKWIMQNFQENLAPDALVLSQDDLTRLTGMIQRMENHKIARGLLDKGIRETTIFWNDSETGDLCKARPDFITEDGLLIDLKTTKDARYKYFSRDAGEYMYHVQAAHYLEAGRVTKKFKYEDFIFLAFEHEAPYEIAAYPLGQQSLESGVTVRRKAMRIYSECKKKNEWPGYNQEAQCLEIPIWHMEPEEMI